MSVIEGNLSLPLPLLSFLLPRILVKHMTPKTLTILITRELAHLEGNWILISTQEIHSLPKGSSRKLDYTDLSFVNEEFKTKKVSPSASLLALAALP